jgi:hypothetical protein
MSNTNVTLTEREDFITFELFESIAKNSPPITRLNSLKQIARKFREKVLESGTVPYYRSFNLVRVPYPVKYGFNNTVNIPTPFLHILNKMFVIQYFVNGKKKTLLFSPSDLDGNEETPFFHRLGKSFGVFEDFGKMMIAPIIRNVKDTLRIANISPEEIDYISFDHLHTQDLRKWLGNGHDPGYFPNAKLLVMQEEWVSVQGLLPSQSDWYCPDGVRNIPEHRVIQLNESTILGEGVAILKTPGHTMGNHSLVVNTPKGILVSSENGISADNYSPLRSKIKGVRDYALQTGSEVILNGNTQESSVEQYISMVIEKEVAGEYIENHDFFGVSPSSEFTSYWAFPGIAPSFEFGEMHLGNLI